MHTYLFGAISEDAEAGARNGVTWRQRRVVARREETPDAVSTLLHTTVRAGDELTSEDWIEAARRSPIYRLAMRYRVALPLHPEYRTLPMVWYIPPLSPVLDAVTGTGADADDPDNVFHAVTDLRIPLEYLASLFSAGDTEVVAGVLMKLSAMRAYMRARTVDGTVATDLLDAVGMTAADMEQMYGLLAIAKYDERYVVPTAHREDAAALAAQADGCSLDGDGGPGMGEFHPTGHPRQALEQFLWWFRDRRPMGLARHYVETFDLRRKSSLYLTYYLHGDTRRRGMALLTLKQRYRLAGLTPPEGELPDFLPVACEFAALAGPAAGEAPLRRHRKGLELIRTALHDSGSPYALVLDALCAMLPGLSAAERSAVADLALAGPPVEEVGLAPFGPPLNEMEARP